IPNWNGARFLRRILQDVSRQSLPPRECIVVDNGSTDDSQAIAKSFGVRLLNLETNRGFAPAVNRGVAESSSPLVAVLNNDLELSADWLEIVCGVLDRYPASSFAVG